jgi:hypothetical protein
MPVERSMIGMPFLGTAMPVGRLSDATPSVWVFLYGAGCLITLVLMVLMIRRRLQEASVRKPNKRGKHSKLIRDANRKRIG